MKNITLSAEEDLIENARSLAHRHDTTLNQMFRDWLAELAARQERGRQAQVDALFDRMLGQVNAGRKFTREEMNES
jgi:predicted transcriptional regulator